MNHTKEQFLTLIRAGLWNSPINNDLFSGSTDWESILRMAKIQTISGIVFDGITKLPPECQPPNTIMRQLYHTVIRIEQSHELLNQQLVNITATLQSDGIDSILLKGQGAAQNYPNPVRRQCGDIDLYIGNENYTKACESLKKWGINPVIELASYKHFHFKWNGVSFEFHRIAERLYNPQNDKKFQIWTSLHLYGDKLRTWKINETNISLPPVNFDALYIFNHLYRHFISGGIGVRQLCDWTLYLHTFNHQINRQELYNDLQSFGILKPWQLFGALVVNWLGLPKEEFPFYLEKYKEDSEIILDKILEIGNFGFYNPIRGERPAGFFSGKFHSFLYHQKYLIGIFSFFPKDVLIFFPWYFTKGIAALFKRH